MDALDCYICNTTSLFYSVNLFKTKSKYSETRICEFIRTFLGDYSSKRQCETININENDHCVCVECLSKIDEYDLAIMTAKRVEAEMRDILLHTEALYFQESKSINTEELFVSSIETPDEYKEANDEFKEEIESIAPKSDSESYKAESDSDEDYIPPGSQRPPQHLVAKSRTNSQLEPCPRPKVQRESRQKCHKCNMEFKRYGFYLICN